MGSGADDASPPPASSVPASPRDCESSLQTLLVADGARGLAAAPDGTLYFSQSAPADKTGVFARTPDGSRLKELSSDQDVRQILLDGTDLLLVSRDIRRLPAAGGSSTLVVGHDGWDVITMARLDATHLFFSTWSSGTRAPSLKRVPRAGGEIETLLSFSASTYTLNMSSFDLGDDRIFLRGGGAIYSMPKSGGTPVVFHENASVSLLVTTKDSVFSDGPSSLFRSAYDPAVAPVRVALPDPGTWVDYGPLKAVADDVAAYVAFERFNTAPGRVMFARLPREGEAISAIGCTSGDGDPEGTQSMALDGRYLYAVLASNRGTGARIVRMPR